MGDRILRIAEVLETTGLGRSSLHRRVNDGTFPAPIRLGGDNSRAVGWLQSEIDEWIATRPRTTDIPHRRRKNPLPLQLRPDGHSIPIKSWNTARETTPRRSTSTAR